MGASIGGVVNYRREVANIQKQTLALFKPGGIVDER